MTDKRNGAAKKALELFERHRVFTAAGVVAVLVALDVWLRLANEKSSGAGAAGHAFLVELVTGLIPIFMVFVGSYILYRRFRSMQEDERSTELKSLIDESVSSGFDSVLEKRIRIARDQPSDTEHFREWIREHQPKEADLIEYSTDSIQDVIVELKSCACKMRILVHDPRAAMEYQRGKVRQRLEHLQRLVLDDYPPGAEVRCYAQFPSVRGRLLDRRVVNVGWYTPDLKNPGMEVLGHSNPLVTANVGTAEGEYLFRMFTGLFEHLWKDATPVADVLAGPKTSARRTRSGSKTGTRRRGAPAR